MVQPSRTQIRCPNCGQPFQAAIEQIIDGGRDPQAKARLLSGRTNVAMCPNCGLEFKLAAPLLYHDATKELLVIHVPMELGLPQAEQDRVIGSMTNAIVNSLPQEQRKGYLLMPKSALTVNGLIEMVLEKDGVTKEMIEARREKLRLAETFMQASEEQWPELVKQYDSQLDEEFIAMITTSANAALANGRQDVAERIVALRETLLEQSTVGKTLIEEASRQETVIQEMEAALQALGEKFSREDFLRVVLDIARQGDDERIQILTNMTRPLMDYQFFEALSIQIDAAKGADKQMMANLRERLVELTGVLDKQAEAVVRQAANNLQAIMNSEDIEVAIRSRLDLIDDTFLSVLSANIQHAEQSGNPEVLSRLKQIFETVMSLLQSSAPPPLRFINELVSQQDPDKARAMLQERAAEFGPELLQLMDFLMEELSGRESSPTLDRLRQLRSFAEQVLSGGRVAGVISPQPTEPEAPPTDQSSGIIIPFTRKSRRKE